MALVLRLRKDDVIKITLEDGRVINLGIKNINRNRIDTYIEGDRAIDFELIKAKDADDESRNPS